jgi:hypothetical protein
MSITILKGNEGAKDIHLWTPVYNRGHGFSVNSYGKVYIQSQPASALPTTKETTK